MRRRASSSEWADAQAAAAPGSPPPRIRKAPPPSRDDTPAAAGVSDALRRLRRDRLVGGEGPAAQGHRHRRGARRCRAAPRPPRPCLVARGGARLAAQARRAGADPVRLRLQLRPAARRARRISARRARRARDRARILGLCRSPERRRGSRRRELPRAGPPPAFLFRHRRRGEGRLHALPPVRRAAERAGRPQDRQRL